MSGMGRAIILITGDLQRLADDYDLIKAEEVQEIIDEFKDELGFD